MSVDVVLARISELQQGLQPRTPAPAATTTDATAFSTALGQATAGVAPTAVTASLGTATTAGQRALQLAQAAVGVAEQPPGSNDSARIAQYRQSTAGSGIGPWCSYFVSWAAQQAGAPVGEAGQGFGAVSALWDWAQRTGRSTPANTGVPPTPGDLIVWDGTHIGIVESVDPDGTIHTIEGNSSNAVTRRAHDATGDGATGYVRLG